MSRKWCEFHQPFDPKKLYRSADSVGSDRIVFSIAGNKHRLVVWLETSCWTCKR
jgi:mRNA-degrading endonuclease HigB of HigAB toxin-antitoxin module